MYYTKEIELIKSYYEEIIYNMSRYLESIGVASDVVGINIIVKYMIQQGFLTNNILIVNGNYFSKIALIEENFISLSESGLLVSYGCSTCRHIANFMYVLYSFLKYQNSQVFVYSPTINIEYKATNDMEKKQIGEVLESLLSELYFDTEHDFETIITRNGIEFSIKYSGVSPDILVRGNHTINIIVDREKSLHIFDSTLNRVGVKSNRSDVIKMYLDNNFYIPQYIKDYFNYNYETTKLEFIDALSLLRYYQTPDIDEEFRRIKEYEQECLGRISEFERFKAQNSEYYDKISGEVRKLVRTLNEESNYV